MLFMGTYRSQLRKPRSLDQESIRSVPDLQVFLIMKKVPQITAQEAAHKIKSGGIWNWIEFHGLDIFTATLTLTISFTR